MHEALQQFLPPIGTWFEQRLGIPTPPQVQGWPLISARQSTLILAPTGSGKTLAAFLAAIDRLARDLLDENAACPLEGGVQILYISPLKALANDVEKNLTTPLEEIADIARQLAHPWPEIKIAVRTGDTPQKQRALIARKPPHLLITTPESLNLILTSGTRNILRTVRYVIIDEVHSLAGNKRGVFLSLLLERLEYLRTHSGTSKTKVAPGVYLDKAPVPPLIRIGLSATVRPESLIARWLGGYGEDRLPRSVQIVNTGQRKRLDVSVICPWGSGAPFEDLPSSGETDNGPPAGRSHWPVVAKAVTQLIREHRSTLVFANSRRLVERLVKMLHDREAEINPLPDPTAEPEPSRILPHHGSISKNVRLATEEALKNGELAAVVTTSSLELGIDIGMLDLVCQIDSPGSVAAALQRVGRAGHLEKATAKGRLIPRMVADLPALAALVPLMYAGQVEESHTPENCLDVLAQQVVAAVVGMSWNRLELCHLFCHAAPYQHLPESQFNSVLEMLSGKFSGIKNADPGSRSLQPRIAFDRVNDQLGALPSSSRIATINAGVIADTGQFAVYIANTRTRIGELDEEFVYETKEGDRIFLGSQVWRVEAIEPDRVTVSPASVRGGARMPFWRGEAAPRSPELGAAMATLADEIEKRWAENPEATRQWLILQHHLDDVAADTLTDLFVRQRACGSAMPTATRVVIEHFVDKTGEPMVAVLTPLGSRVHQTLRLALEATLAQRGLLAQIIHSDDGIIIRATPETIERMGDVIDLLTPETLEPLVLEQLEQSSLFGLRFRQNAARALLLPRPDPKRRMPLWQQRLRARNLLVQVKQYRNFPIVVETYRECLQDVLLLDRARQMLADIRSGKIQLSIHSIHAPSPVSRATWQNFEAAFLYQWDDPMAADQASNTVDKTILDYILQRQTGENSVPAISWTPADVVTLQRRLDGADYPARNAEELLERIAAAGAVALGPPDDPAWRDWVISDPVPLLQELQHTRRLVCMNWISSPLQTHSPEADYRWIATESLAPYLAALGHQPPLFIFDGDQRIDFGYGLIPPALLHFFGTQAEARELLVMTELRRHACNTLSDLVGTLPFMSQDIPGIVQNLLRGGALVSFPSLELPSSKSADQVAEPYLLLPEYADQLRSMAIRRLRKDVSTSDLSALQSHLLRWHRIGPVEMPSQAKKTEPSILGVDALEDALDQLSPLAFPLSVWQHDILPVRVPGFVASQLDELCATGHWVWVGYAGSTREGSVAFLPRHLLGHRPGHAVVSLSEEAQRLLGALEKQGASFSLDLELSLLPAVDAGEGKLNGAFRELVFAGLISNDRLESLQRVLSAEEENPVAKGVENNRGRYPGSFGVERGMRLGRRRRGRGNEALGGRWFLLPAAVGSNDALGVAERAAERVERLLRRNGFACRELCVTEADGSWRDCYDVLTRMEWAGTVRRGYFVEGITGAQFALPSVDLSHSAASSGEGGVVWVAFLDPANLYGETAEGWVTPKEFDVEEKGLRIPRMQGSWLALLDGKPVLAAVSWGGTLLPLTGDWEGVEAGLRAVPELLGRLPRGGRGGKHFLQVRRWLEGDILGSAAEGILREVGFEREPQGLRLYRKYRF